MTTRKWKLEGSINWPGKLIIKIDGVTVADKVDAAESTYEGRTFIASGTFDVDDSVDSKHSIEIEVYEGSMNVGTIWWDNAYVSAALSAEAEQYKFDHNNIPEGANVPTPKTSEWGSRDPDAFSWYPGKGTLFSVDTIIREQDPRGNVKVNSNEFTVPAQFYELLATVGTTVTFDFGIPGNVSPGAPE